MRRILVLLSFLVSIGCKPSKPGQGPAPGSPVPPAAAAERPAGPRGDSKPAAVTTDLVDRYAGFERERFARADAFQRKMATELNEARKKGADESLRVLQRLEQEEAKLNEWEDGLRQKWKLTSEELDTAWHVVEDVGLTRFAWVQMNGDAELARLEAEGKAHVEAVPAGERQGAQAELDRNVEALRRVRDMAEPRAKYGDAVVEHVLKSAAEIVARRFEALQATAAPR